MITVWNINAVEGYEADCRDLILKQLEALEIETDLLLVFGVRFLSEELDLLLIGPNGFVIGDLKNTRSKLRGSYNGPWSFVQKNGRATSYGRSKSPHLQVLIQRKELRKILQKRPSIFIRNSKTRHAIPPDWCDAGLVQVPKLNAQITGIEDKWWYVCGVDNWLPLGIEKATSSSQNTVNLKEVSKWLEHIGCKQYQLDSALSHLELQDEEEDEDEDYSNEQLAALKSDYKKPLVIIAGPGAGKTHVLAERVRRLRAELQDTNEWIAVITYTNAAKNQLKDRLGFSTKENSNCFIGTVHQFAKSYIEQNSEGKQSIQVLDEYQATRKLSQIAEISFEESKKVLDLVSQHIDLSTEQLRQYHLFLEHMKLFNLATFHTLLTTALEISNSSVTGYPKYIVVDEYQDSGPAQVELFISFSSKGSILNVVGDPEQAIFEPPTQILTFQNQFPGALLKKLKINYRSCQNIVQLSNEIRAEDDILDGQETNRVDNEGAIHFQEFASDYDQDAWIVKWINELVESTHFLKDIAILYRENKTGKRIKRLLEKNEIPVWQRFDYTRLTLTSRLIAILKYIEKPDSFYALSTLFDLWPGMGDILGGKLISVYQQLSLEMGKDCDVQRTISQMPSSLEADSHLTKEWNKFQSVIDDVHSLKTLELNELLTFVWETLMVPAIEMKDREHVETLEQVICGAIALCEYDPKMTISDICKSIQTGDIKINGGSDVPNGVFLTTVASAKGLEWKSVAVVDICAGIFPNWRAENCEDASSSERRGLHVAVSRAETNLALCCPERVERRRGVSEYTETLASILQ